MMDGHAAYPIKLFLPTEGNEKRNAWPLYPQGQDEA